MINKELKIVPVEEIPKAKDTPLDNLMDLIKVAFAMEIVCEKNSGIGLSAVQVGLAWKMFIVCNKEKNYDYYVNCEYVPLTQNKIKSIEGCLSLKKEDGSLRYFEVERYETVKILGKKLIYKPELKLIEMNEVIDDYYSVVFQHEIEHGLGVLISSVGKEIQLERKNL